MKRYFSHYTYIYPDIYLKSHIVEMDDDGKIIRWFPFEREIEKTEFYDGVVVFVPEGETFDKEVMIPVMIKSDFLSSVTLPDLSNISYNVINIEDFCLKP